MDWALLSLFTLELCYYLSMDHTACAVLAGARVAGTLAWLYVTKRRQLGISVDTSYHVAPVIPLHRGKKRT